MSDLIYFFSPVIQLMKMEFTIYGYTISFWQLFLLSIILGFIGSALGKLFGGD